MYKLSATRSSSDDAWSARLKVSEQSSKLTLPGVLDVRRYRFSDGRLAGDMVFDVNEPIDENGTIIDPADLLRCKELGGLEYETLLAPLARGGESMLPDERSVPARRLAAARSKAFAISMNRRSVFSTLIRIR